MPGFCTECGKKRKLNNDRICTPCVNKSAPAATDTVGIIGAAAAPDPPPPPPTCDVDDEETLNNVKFGSLKSWLNATFAHHVTQLDERLSREIGAVKDDLQTTKTSLDQTNAEIAKLKKELTDYKKATNEKVVGLDTRVKTLDTDAKKQKIISENNLKYLINLDRNERRRNVIIFGVPEQDLTIEDVTVGTDQKKCELILNYIGVPAVIDEVREMFRLGKPVEDKVRPIKLKLNSSDDVTSILDCKGELNKLPQTIYIKPDKSKSEVTEYQRMGKRKKELEEQYPVPEGARPRVVLDKGVLTLDGTTVDEFKPVQSLF